MLLSSLFWEIDHAPSQPPALPNARAPASPSDRPRLASARINGWLLPALEQLVMSILVAIGLAGVLLLGGLMWWLMAKSDMFPDD
jgi:hypothetical protein